MPHGDRMWLCRTCKVLAGDRRGGAALQTNVSVGGIDRAMCRGWTINAIK